jgi:hypothetical protein
MVRQPNRQSVLTVRAVKVAAATAVAGVAMMATLGGATASSADVEETAPDVRCAGAAGKAIVRSQAGTDRAVPFEHGWRVYRGERPGTLVVVCPS